MRANMNASRTTIFLWLSLVLSPTVLGDAGYHAGRVPAAPEGVDRGKASMASRGAAAVGDRWTAPAEAVRRGNPVPSDSFSRARGRKLFEANCVGCHGPTGRGDGPAAARLDTLPPDLYATADQYPDGDLAWKIANGRGAMPAWKKVLTVNQIWDLVNFIHDLDDSPWPGHTHKH